MVRKLFTALIISISFVYGEAVVEEVQQKVVMGDALSKKDARVYALDMAKFVVLNKKSTYIEYSFTKEKSNNGKNITKEVLSSLGGAYATSELVDGTEDIKDGVYNAKIRVSIDMDSFNRKIKALEENTEIKEQLEALKSSAEINNKELFEINKKIENVNSNILNDKELNTKQKEERIIELQIEQKKVLDKISANGTELDKIGALQAEMEATKLRKEAEERRVSEEKHKKYLEGLKNERIGVATRAIDKFMKFNNMPDNIYKDDPELIYIISTGVVDYEELLLSYLNGERYRVSDYKYSKEICSDAMWYAIRSNDESTSEYRQDYCDYMVRDFFGKKDYASVKKELLENMLKKELLKNKRVKVGSRKVSEFIDYATRIYGMDRIK